MFHGYVGVKHPGFLGGKPKDFRCCHQGLPFAPAMHCLPASVCDFFDVDDDVFCFFCFLSVCLSIVWCKLSGVQCSNF